MTTKSLLGCAVVALALMTTAAHAVPIVYEGTLSPGVTVGGFIQDPSQIGSPNDDFWRFQANRGDRVTITINRLMSDLDPAVTLYQGEGSDTDQLVLLPDNADDNYDELPGFDGPFSDPQLIFTAETTGWYTVQVWDFASLAQVPGGSCYQITLNGEPSAPIFDCQAGSVPAPSSLALAGLGLLGLGALRAARRRAG